MSRYFIEVTYRGTRYAGFQTQKNANSIQAEVEKALSIFYKTPFGLTGSSRTDAGVHALQNYFHFDFESEILPAQVYNLNAILPADIVIKRIVQVASEAHCRFDALSREYKYFIYQNKNPFLDDRAYFFPYVLNTEWIGEAAEILKDYSDFTSFSKRNTQVKSFQCQIEESKWTNEDGTWIYHVKANRFLRGMIRGLVGTMLQVGRGKLNVDGFRKIIEAKDCTQADFAVPGHGLFLVAVNYPVSFQLA